MAKTKKKQAEKDTTPKEVVDFEKGVTQLYKKMEVTMLMIKMVLT